MSSAYHGARLRRLYAIAAEVVDSGVGQQFDTWLAEQRASRRRPGRLPTVAPRTVLIGLLMALLDNRKPRISTACDMLRTLPRDVRDKAGFRRQSSAAELARDQQKVRNVSYRAMARAFNRLAAVIEVSPHFAPDADPAALEDNQRLLRAICDAVVAATLDGEDLTGEATIDGTFIAAHTKNVKKTKTHLGADPDARWLVKGGSPEMNEHEESKPKQTDGNKGKKSKSRKSNAVLGYLLSGVAQSTADGGLRMVGIDVTTSTDERTPARSLIERLVGVSHYEIDSLVMDKGYSDAGFVADVRGHGITPRFDLNLNQRGSHGTIPDVGAKVVDAYPYCVAMPERFHDVGQPPSQWNDVDAAEYRALHEERSKWAFKRLGRPNEDGTCRMQCPAERGTVICPLKPQSAGYDPAKAAVLLEDEVPTDAPKCCTQRTVTIPAQVDNLPLLPMEYGGPDWIDAYKPGRALIEAAWGTGKDPALSGLGKRGIIVRGRTRMTLMLALCMAAINLRLRHGLGKDYRKPQDEQVEHDATRDDFETEAAWLVHRAKVLADLGPHAPPEAA